MVLKAEQDYCRFARGDNYVCPYQPEERTISFCMCCKLREITSQQNLLIRQNNVVIILLEHIRDLLKNSVVGLEPPDMVLQKIEG